MTLSSWVQNFKMCAQINEILKQDCWKSTDMQVGPLSFIFL